VKKIILILLLFLSCYIIYQFTKNNNIYYLSIGDSLAVGTTQNGSIGYGYSDYIKDYLKESNKLKGYNKAFTNNNYRITDLLRIIQYNETIKIDNQEISLTRLIKKADIITLSIGMNELYYKLNSNTDNIYSYMNQMLSDIKRLLEHINYFNHKKVFVLNYYNVTGNNYDIFSYLNYELKELVLEEGFEYIDLTNIFDNNPTFFKNNSSFIPNNEGYQKISQIVLEKIKNY